MNCLMFIFILISQPLQLRCYFGKRFWHGLVFCTTRGAKETVILAQSGHDEGHVHCVS